MRRRFLPHVEFTDGFSVSYMHRSNETETMSLVNPCITKTKTKKQLDLIDIQKALLV